MISTRAKLEGRSLHERIMLRRGIDVRADARNGTVAAFEARHAKVGNLQGFAIARQQEILWLDVAMDDAALVRVREARADLLQIEERAIEAEFLFAAILRHVAPAEIFQHQIMKRGAIEIECGAVTEAADDIGMTNAIEGNCFILKILDESLFEIGILITLKQHIQSFDDDFAELLVRRRQIA